MKEILAVSVAVIVVVVMLLTLDKAYKMSREKTEKILDQYFITQVQSTELSIVQSHGFGAHQIKIAGWYVMLSNEREYAIRKYYYMHDGVKAEYIPKIGEKLNPNLILWQGRR